MKKTLCLFVLFFIITTAASVSAQVLDAPMWDESTELNPNDLKTYRDMVWETWKDDMMADETLLMETSELTLEFGNVQMYYFIYAADGDKPENGYPLYIALHGGGNSQKNDSQWDAMKSYYLENLEVGMYVAPRGIRDTWDTHFNPESYPLYDRLIEYMILTEDVDPNRVYLEGFSAGGDGVYAIANRMTDRFAAANMSSGHPNGISMVNLYNMPIQLQAGEYDDEYDRNRVTAEYGLKLDALQAEYGGYEHRTLIHYDCGHNYEDYEPTHIPVMADVAAWLNNGDRTTVDVDSFPPDYMDDFIRDPYPTSIIWDLSTRADTRETETFYYLSAPYTTNQGMIQVASAGDNGFAIEADDVNGEFSILLNEYMVDFSRPVTFIINEEETTLNLTPDMAVLAATTEDRGDPWYQFEAMVTFTK